MTATQYVPLLAEVVPGSVKKKRVLLVDGSARKRDLRADTMRKLGMDVDCAADILEARSWWRADLYNLVLINVENDLGHRDKFCEEIRGARPPQQCAFLVGKPEYLADFPNADGVPALASTQRENQGTAGDIQAALAVSLSGSQDQPWGILTASRRISAVRSLSHARTKAVQDRPAPIRDVETRVSKRADVWSQMLPELKKEEMQ